MAITNEQLSTFVGLRQSSVLPETITTEDIDTFAGMPITFTPQYRPSMAMSEKLQKSLWPSGKIQSAQKSLELAVLPNPLKPPTQEQQQLLLQDWWQKEGQSLPRFVLDEIGIIGGEKIPTQIEQLRLAKEESVRRQVEIVDNALGIGTAGDPLQNVLAAGFIADPTSIGPAPEPTDIKQTLRQFDRESIDVINELVQDNLLFFSEETVATVGREAAVRKREDRFLEFMQESPGNVAVVMLGSDFFDRLALGFPEFLSERTTEQEKAIDLEAISRIRSRIKTADPGLLTTIGTSSGDAAAEIIWFAALPNPAKLAAFSGLSATAKAAINVGGRSGLVALLQAPEEGETPQERFAEVALATGIGALTGATVEKIVSFVKAIPVNIRARELVKKFPEFTQKDAVEILKAIERGPIDITFRKPIPAARRVPGARAGFADIQKPTELAGKVVAKGAKAPVAKGTTAKIALEAAKKLPSKAVPVKPVKPTKILTKAEALSFQESNLVTGEAADIRIVPDEKSRRLLNSSVKEIARLKTQKAQLAADKKVALAKAKEVGKTAVQTAKAIEIGKKEKDVAVEIAKRESQIVALKEKQGIKVATTIDEFKAKITKIDKAIEFKEDLRNDAISMIQAIPSELRANFLKRAVAIGTKSQRPETSLKKLFTLNDEVREGISKFEQRSAINNAKAFKKKLFKTHALGKQPLGKLPEPQRSQILDITNKIDFVSLTGKKEFSLDASKKHFKKLAGEIAGGFESLDAEELSELQVPRKLSRELRRLEQMNVGDMTTSDIQAIYDSLTSLAKQAELKQSLLIKGGKKPLSAIDVKKEISPKPSIVKRKETPLEPGKKRKGGPLKALGRFATVNNYHLDTLTDISTTNEAKGIQKILDDDLHAGQKVVAENQMKLFDETSTKFKEIGFKSLKQLENKSTVSLANQSVKLDDNTLLSLEMMTRDEDFLNALRSLEGWEIEGDLFLYPKEWGFGEKLAELNNLLVGTRQNEMLVGLADITNGLSNGVFRNLINDTSNVLVGHDIARVTNQWPRPRSGTLSVSGPKDISLAPEQQSILQPRIGSSKPIRLRPWAETFMGSLETITFFNGMSVELRNARILVSSQDFQRSMISAGRENELKNIITLLRRIQGVNTSKSVVEVLGSVARELFTVRALGFRVSTTGTQAMSAPAFYSVTGTFSPVPRITVTEAIKRIKEDSARINLRWRGRRIGVEVGAAASREAFEIMFFGKTKLLSSNTSMKQHVKGDQLAFGTGYVHNIIPDILFTARNGNNIPLSEWNGRDAADIKPLNDIDSKEFREAAARRMEYAARRSQPMFDMLDRSVNLSDPSALVRVPTMFRTALEAQQNLLVAEVSRYSKSAKTFKDARKLWSVFAGVTASAVAVAMWKKAWKWGIRFGSKKVKEQLGIFQFDEDKDVKEVSVEVAKSAAKNLVNLSPLGKVVNVIADDVANAITPDGYNWNREPWDDPMLDFILRVGETAASIGESVADIGKLNNFADESENVSRREKAGDVKFNEQLADDILDDWIRTATLILDMGTTLARVPVLAPSQEFIKPILKDSKIRIIREVTFGDVDDPQDFSQRVFDLYERRSDIRAKSKTKRLSKEEEQNLGDLDKFVAQINKATDIIRESNTDTARKFRFAQVERLITTTENRTKE